MAEPAQALPAARVAQIPAFLARSGWSGATRVPLAGDASGRRYERLSHPRLGHAVLMDADPGRGEAVAPFVRMARHLRGLGLSAPEVLAGDGPAGLLLLEDLGDGLFPRLIDAEPARARDLYAEAAGVLAVVQAAPPPPDLAAPDADAMAGFAALALDWYVPAATGRPAPDPGALTGALRAALAAVADDPPCLLLRDYHAGNLLWLPGRVGVARVGLLDFQDAHLGNRCYDLVSMLEDARRDVPADIRHAVTAGFLAATGLDKGLFQAQWAATAAQRHLRILGIFARLALRDGKRGYLPMLPRVWADLRRALDGPGLAGLRDSVLAQVPPPDAAVLARIAAA